MTPIRPSAVWRPEARRRGATLVELLVVMLIVVIIVAGIGGVVATGLALDQKFLEETAVRSALALQMAYAERYFSLASSVSDTTASFPLEAGGVSLETSHWIRVTDNAMSVTPSGLVFQITSTDPSYSETEEKRFEPFWLMNVNTGIRNTLGRQQQSTNVNNLVATLEGNGAVRRLTLEAAYTYWTYSRANRAGVWTTGVIRVDRPIWLWNQ